MANRPSVFISYAHKDGMDFVRRLAFALEMYMDVYWDRRLQAGSYPVQLFSEIENRDYFLFVMTPYSLDSKWCRDELNYAEQNGKQIALARVYSGEGTTDSELDSNYTYGDFTEDFDVGFRRLTAMILGQPFSSWELLSLAPTKTLLSYLKYGAIPGLIAKTFIEWVVVAKIWNVLQEYAIKYNLSIIHQGKHFTPSGVLNLCPVLIEEYSQSRNFVGISMVSSAKPIIEKFVSELMLLNDNNHIVAGKLSSELLEETKKFLLQDTTLNRDFKLMATIQGWFDFEVAEKLRVLINDHSRRSKYLY